MILQLQDNLQYLLNLRTMIEQDLHSATQPELKALFAQIKKINDTVTPLILQINGLLMKELINTLKSQRDNVKAQIEKAKDNTSELLGLSHQYEQLENRIQELEKRYPNAE